MNRIIFVFPRKHIGGVQTLFLRLANELSEHVDVSVVDYLDGYLAQGVGSNVDLIEFQDGVPIEIPEKSTVILEADLVYNDEYKFCKSRGTRVFFWKLHPLNLQLGYLKKRNILDGLLVYSHVIDYLTKPSKEIISLIMDSNSLYHMDGATVAATRSISGDTRNFPLLPLYFRETNRNFFVGSDESNSINLVWLGRLEIGFKSIPLIKLIEDLKRIDFDMNINFTIIGSGNGEDLIIETTKEIDGINFVFKGTMEGNELRNCLLQNDIAFAMGTSALHTASLGIPTVLLDCSFTAMPDDYLYRWVFETKDYSLGYIVDSNPYSIPQENKHNLHNMISRDDLVECSRLCKKYVDEVYSKELEEYLVVFNSSRLNLDKFLQAKEAYCKKSIIYRFRKLRKTLSNVKLLKILWLKVRDFF